MIKDDHKNGKLREMIYKFWYRRYFDPNYDPSDMVLFINSVLMVTRFKKPGNYWERIMRSSGSVEALCDRLVRAADSCRNLEDKVISIINDVIGGEKLRILPMSVAHGGKHLCSLCRWCGECGRWRNKERYGSWLRSDCGECSERRTFFDSVSGLPSLIDSNKYIVVGFAGNYEACGRCGGLVY